MGGRHDKRAGDGRFAPNFSGMAAPSAAAAAPAGFAPAPAAGVGRGVPLTDAAERFRQKAGPSPGKGREMLDRLDLTSVPGPHQIDAEVPSVTSATGITARWEEPSGQWVVEDQEGRVAGRFGAKDEDLASWALEWASESGVAGYKARMALFDKYTEETEAVSPTEFRCEDRDDDSYIYVKVDNATGTYRVYQAHPGTGYPNSPDAIDGWDEFITETDDPEWAAEVAMM